MRRAAPPARRRRVGGRGKQPRGGAPTTPITDLGPIAKGGTSRATSACWWTGETAERGCADHANNRFGAIQYNTIQIYLSPSYKVLRPSLTLNAPLIYAVFGPQRMLPSRARIFTDDISANAPTPHRSKLQTAPTGRAAWLNLRIVPVPSRVLGPILSEVCQSRKRWHFDDDESVGCCYRYDALPRHTRPSRSHPRCTLDPDHRARPPWPYRGPDARGPAPRLRDGAIDDTVVQCGTVHANYSPSSE